MRYDDFKMQISAEIIPNTDNCIALARKYLMHGTPYVFDGNEAKYFEFKKIISDKFDIGHYEVFIVGSAKLGFSIIKKTDFSYDSDIDVAMVSAKLFNSFCETISDVEFSMYRERRALTETETKKYAKFLRYMAMGWIRPDMLPVNIGLAISEAKKDWFEFFENISYEKCQIGNYKVTAGLYRSHRELERYQAYGFEHILK